MNINFGLLPPLEERIKEKSSATKISRRALDIIDKMMTE